MADNLAVTPGVGASIATDQLPGGEHAQFFKLLDGKADSAHRARVTEAGMLLVLDPDTQAAVEEMRQSLRSIAFSLQLLVGGGESPNE